ncbi:hypothetical protein [Desulfonatronospira sp.]|uniref:hypothetical protein n=1 Tax=Desulfonatronospira sp. TaxID=1962951 RepID=UPI0025C1FD16|nr:hypothetical protein [Desulfonatronospira sp.]
MTLSNTGEPGFQQAFHKREGVLFKHIAFWAAFTILGIWGQYFMPGMDFFSPGLVVLVQSGYYSTALWMGLLWMLLLEGSGNLAFGTVILYYSGLLAAYFSASAFFEAKNLLFMAILYLFLSVLKKVLIQVMAGMQGLGQSVDFALEPVLVQFVLYFLLWCITFYVFHKCLMHEPVRGKKSAA